MKKRKSWLYGFSEANLILWLCMFGFFMRADFSTPEDVKMAKYFSIAGFILAAFLQHWAYYNVYRPAKGKLKEEKAQNTALDGTSQ